MKLSRFRYSDGYEPDDYYEYNEHFSSSRNSYKEKTDALRTLISHIQKIDSLKDEILNRNVSLSKLAFLTKLLNDPITLNGFRDRDKSFMLSKPIDIEESFFNAGLLNMVLDVRRGQFLFPKYCLCEGKKSYFRNYGVITSEYYQSFD